MSEPGKGKFNYLKTSFVGMATPKNANENLEDIRKDF
jgi:hypothetical protein